MIPKALLLSSLLGLLPAFMHAQSFAIRHEVVPVRSLIYHETLHLYVYTAKGKKEAPATLPVIYVPGVGKKDHTFFARLDKLVQEGVLPPMRIVGIEPGAGIPDLSADSEAYLDPKHLSSQNPDVDAFYYAFIVGEVIPAIEKRYTCAPYKTLYTDGAGSFPHFVLKNYAGTFTTYLSLSPFALYDPRTSLRYVKGPIPQPGTQAASWLEEYTPDEYALKTGRPGWINDQ